MGQKQIVAQNGAMKPKPWIVKLTFSAFLLAIFMCKCPAQGKIIYTARFTDLLDAFSVQYIFPGETYYHAEPRADMFHKYALCLKEDAGRTEFRYVFVGEAEIPAGMPHLYASNGLSHAASNESMEWILQSGHALRDSNERFNADWSNESKFRPKESFSEMEWCRQYALYKHDKGLVLIYACYNDLDDLPPDDGNLLKFKKAAVE